MTRIERPVAAAADACFVKDLDNVAGAFVVADGDMRDGVSTLANIVHNTIADRPVAERVTVEYTYRIVVRLRDGTRHVFNEPTARALRSGEQILVIAGNDSPSF